MHERDTRRWRLSVPVSATIFAAWMMFTLAVQAQPLPSIEKATENTVAHTGFFNVFWDDTSGKIWLEIPAFGEDFLYIESLPYGLGSNDIGLDRGQLGDRWVVRFERYGPKILLVAPNLRYRAVGAPRAEVESVREAFAEGVLWGFDAVAETDGRVLVDATDFVVRYAHRVIVKLKNAGQGTFELDKTRSVPVPDVVKSFPANTEMEARLTFTSDSPGAFVRDVAAVPTSFSVRQRHSFVRLPGPGFTPRSFHPRSGFFGPSFDDYSRPIGADLTVRFIARHRLQKKNPGAAVSEPVKPIIYYLDPGTPEPVRSALLEGARWWDEAFEAAGFRNAFRVEMLPEGADPMDIRYNVIQWVHRATRGWSYGEAVTDPRTGEIIKGHVSLGSLRVRQDYLIAEGLLAPYKTGWAEDSPPESDPMLEMALARIRQLSAHEVGHTIGLAHNFAASVFDRASVMDYPAPLARVGADGTIDLESAYAIGIGEWDKLAVRYGYGEPAPGQSEDAYLAAVLEDARVAEISYITDDDARPPGAAQPFANLWDNGADMVEALQREMAVRRAAMSHFGADAIRPGRPLAQVEEVLVPLYLRHRYQIEATVKLIGGVEYEYEMRGDADTGPVSVSAGLQRSALAALLDVVSPSELRLPDGLVETIPPRPFGYPANRELFSRHTGLTFDPYAPAEALTTHLISLLLDPERAMRLVIQGDLDRGLPSFADVLKEGADRFFSREPDDPVDAELARIAQQAWVDGLVRLSMNAEAAPAVAARASGALKNLERRMRSEARDDEEASDWRGYMADQIQRFVTRPFESTDYERTPNIPPGSPIGGSADPVMRRFERSERLLRTYAADEECRWSSGLR